MTRFPVGPCELGTAVAAGGRFVGYRTYTNGVRRG